MKQFEGLLTSFDETQIFYQIWENNPQHKKWIVITHGQGEHSGCYQRLISGLSHLDYNFIAWDLRGHGRSEGKRGYANEFNDYCLDFIKFKELILDSLTDSAKSQWLGHSMGGLIQLSSLLQIPGGIEYHQILSNPYLGLSLSVPAYKEIGSILLKNYLPKLTLYNEIQDHMCSQDPEVLVSYRQDVLRHHKISAGVHVGAQSAQKNVLARAGLFKGTLLMLLSEHDPIVSTTLNKMLFEQISSKKKLLKIYKNRKHELFNDLHREDIFLDVRDWCEFFN